MSMRGKNGFTMVEVLVSIFVLSLGVIGVAGMQLNAMRVSQQSSYQTVALQLASEMADKMRSNDAQMKLADSLNPFLAVNYNAATDGAPTAPNKICYSSAADCNAEELAKFDIYELETRIRDVLPGGRITICRDTTPWDTSAGAFKWACTASLAAVDNASMVVKIGWQAKNPDGTLVRDADKAFPPGVALTVEPYTK